MYAPIDQVDLQLRSTEQQSLLSNYDTYEHGRFDVDFTACGTHSQDIFFTGLENDIGLSGGAHNGYP